ncbi:MAG: segregation/condensation protein A [Devosiaceae bacterium]|nr:segregation/condensation protein A [Devosiaceae bacterium]
MADKIVNSTNKDWALQAPDDSERAQDLDQVQVLYVDVDGFEGPLDLLLDMARRQKVDLANISVLSLAEQYLLFIEKVRKERIEVAADYLVMAAWLAYLKSRLMLPQIIDDEEPSGEMMAAILQFRLKRLEAMRNAAAQLVNRARLGREIFARGDPEAVAIVKETAFDTSLFQLLSAYAGMRERNEIVDYAPKKRVVWSLKDARSILERLIGEGSEWLALDKYLAQYLASPAERNTVLASSFSAGLELVREGSMEMRQTLTFGPLLMRRKRSAQNSAERNSNEENSK